MSQENVESFKRGVDAWNRRRTPAPPPADLWHVDFASTSPTVRIPHPGHPSWPRGDSEGIPRLGRCLSRSRASSRLRFAPTAIGCSSGRRFVGQGGWQRGVPVDMERKRRSGRSRTRRFAAVRRVLRPRRRPRSRGAVGVARSSHASPPPGRDAQHTPRHSSRRSLRRGR